MKIYIGFLGAVLASTTCAASVQNVSESPAARSNTKLRKGHSAEAKSALPHGIGGHGKASEDAELQTELEGVISLSMESRHNGMNLDPEAVAKMEKAVTELVTKVDAKTPMGSSIRQISSLLKDTLMPQVLKAHQTDVDSINKLAIDLTKCGSAMKGEEAVANIQKSEYLRFSPLHKVCRRKEAMLATSLATCEERLGINKKIMDLTCAQSVAYATSWGTQAKNSQVVVKGAGETPDIYMKRLHDTYCGSNGLSFYNQYQELQFKCENVKGTYQGMKDGCDATRREYKIKISECNNMQSQMDGAACNRAVLIKDSCESYAGCYSDNRLAFVNSKTVMQKSERDRKGEWRALKRMMCLIEGFEDEHVEPDEIEMCKHLAHDTWHLEIVYPEIAKPVSCVVPDRYPATASYKKIEFAPLPALARGNPDANECYGVTEISTKPRAGSPKTCKCQRVTINGPYSAGALVKCTDCNVVSRSTEKDSCPYGTKIFSPRTRSDWHTILASVTPLQNPDWIVDITRPKSGCAGCGKRAMNSDEQKGAWATKDGSPWWLRSSLFSEPSGDYEANCYLSISPKVTSENDLKFNDAGCQASSSSYYCQQKWISTTPKAGSPKGCQCERVELTAKYSAGALLKCVGCNVVKGSMDKDSCPEGTKLFSPRSREDWKTVLDSAGPLRSPQWIVDVTRPEDGSGFMNKITAAMNFETPASSSWRTQDGSPWWLRSTAYKEPSGDYKANCYMDLWESPTSADSVTFNDGGCSYSSNAYYCQPRAR